MARGVGTPQERGCGHVAVRVNARYGTVGWHEVRRVFRSAIGDWCIEVIGAGGHNRIEVFDYHPTAAVLALLKKHGANIPDDIVAQGAEGVDIGRRGD